MQEHHDQFTLSLLRNDPDKFLLLCQPIIKIWVRQYMARGVFPFGDEHDIIQTVNERLFSSLPLVAKNYNGRVLLKTYINVVIKNICWNIDQEQYRNIKTIRFSEENAQYVHDPTDAMVMEEELERLHLVLQLFPTTRYKLYLCMKLFFKIPLHREDILQWHKGIQQSQMELLMSTFGKKYDHMRIQEIFKLFAPVLHSVEHNSTPGRGIERWINKNVTIVLKLMNGNPPRRTHSKETLQVLLSEEYSRTINKEKL